LGLGEALAKAQVPTNPVTEPKRSPNPKRPLSHPSQPRGYSISENALVRGAMPGGAGSSGKARGRETELLVVPREIDAFPDLIANHSFLHPAHREQVPGRREQPVPDAIMTFAREPCVVADGNFRDPIAFDLEQGRQKTVHPLEKFQMAGALALEDAIGTGGIADVFPRDFVAHAIGDFR